MFEPLVPGAIKVPNTNFYRAPYFADDYEAFGRWAADEIDRAIEREGPRHRCSRIPRAGAELGWLLSRLPPGTSSEYARSATSTAFCSCPTRSSARSGASDEWFGCQRYDYQPDMITIAKGLTSGYAPLGAVIASDKLIEPFLHPKASFLHGITFAGHPVSCAVALANVDVFEREDVLGHVRENEAAFRASLETLSSVPIVGDIRGAGFFWAIELVKDQDTRESFDDEESEKLLRGFVSPALFDAGLICRADDRGDPVIQLSPPLICGQEQFDEMSRILRDVLTEAARRL